MPLGKRNSVGWRVRRTPWRALQETGDWAATQSAVRKLIGRRKRAFRPPAPMLGDDGKPLASLRAKANQHQREFKKEFGENCVEFSEAEHLANTGQASGSCRAHWAAGHKRLANDGARVGGYSHTRQSQVIPTSRTRSPLELIAAGGQGHRPARSALCANVSREGAPILWKGTWRPSLANHDNSLRAIRKECCAPVARERCVPVCRSQQTGWHVAKLERLEAEERNS